MAKFDIKGSYLNADLDEEFYINADLDEELYIELDTTITILVVERFP